jgi:hypothetical protein
MSFQNARVFAVSADPTEYHRHEIPRGQPGYVMSSSALREFGRCPDRWVSEFNPPESDSKDYGSLFDCLALTPEQFSKRYVLQPATYTNEKREVKDWSGNANVCKEWKARQKELGIEVVSQKDLDECQNAIKRMMSKEVIKSFFEASDRQVWVKGEWNDPATGLVIPVQCLIDFVPRVGTEFEKCLGDLKTTRNAAVLAWQRDCYTMGYHVQAAFYQDLYIAATVEDRNTWCFVLSENIPPFQPGKRILTQDFYALGKADYVRLLENYCACLKHGHWPDYDDTDEAVQSWSLVAPEPWMANRAQFAPRFIFGEGVAA